MVYITKKYIIEGRVISFSYPKTPDYSKIKVLSSKHLLPSSIVGTSISRITK